MGSDDVVLVGYSTRALAESAVRAGYRCRTVDAFGDLDQKARVENVALGRDLGRRYGAGAAAVVARRFPGGAVAYVTNLENHPAAVRRLAAGRRLLGNDPSTLIRVRDPWLLAEVVRAVGARVPWTLSRREAIEAPGERAWLRKPLRGGGGTGVAPWTPGEPLGFGEVAQERIEGTLASVAFAADGRRAVVLGLSLQLAGDPAFGATGFDYTGSLLAPIAALGGAAVVDRARDLADAVTRAFGLRGVNGIDFILRDGELHVLEVNPRYTASMELIERAHGVSIFDVHVRACGGELPVLDPAPSLVETFGKAILYARRDVTVGDTRGWLERDDVRDVPFPGESIAEGVPVCTVFARGPDPAACHARLIAKALALEEEIRAGSGRDP